MGKEKFKNIYIILVNPQTEQNIGTSARALKNMGLSNLYLVNPIEYKVEKTYYLAWGAEDIIDNAVCFDNLKDAVSDMNLVIGTTQRKRKRRNMRPLQTPNELCSYIKEHYSCDNKIAILFGSERTGLTRDELEFCHVLSSIPHHTDYPSLNLAQAVMIYCYEFYKNLGENKPVYKPFDMAVSQDLEEMYLHFEKVLTNLEFESITTMTDFVYMIKRIFGKTAMEKRDIHTMHLILNFFEQKKNKKVL